MAVFLAINFTSFALLIVTFSTILYACAASAGLIFPRDGRQRPAAIQSGGEAQEEVTWKLVLGMVAFSSAALVVLYFFVGSIMIFLKIVLLASCFVSTAFALWDWVWQMVQHNAAASVADAAIALGCCIVWFITEHWMVTNVLTFCLCAAAIALVKVRRLSVALAVAGAFVAYDVWWVFLSPLVFGDSVMVVAATGAVEHIPIAFAAPNGGHNALIGAGDVVIPGIVIDFFLRYDLRRGGNYFAVAMGAYAVGVALSWVMVEAMGRGQPALLWIFPSVLAAVLGTAKCRGDLVDMWEWGTEERKQEAIDENLIE